MGYLTTLSLLLLIFVCMQEIFIVSFHKNIFAKLKWLKRLTGTEEHKVFLKIFRKDQSSEAATSGVL